MHQCKRASEKQSHVCYSSCFSFNITFVWRRFCLKSCSCGIQRTDFREKNLAVFGKISSYNDLTTTPLQIGPRVDFSFPRKSTTFSVWSSFNFHQILLYFIYYPGAPAVTNLSSITKTSVNGLVVQSELIIPRKITHFQFLETYPSLSGEGQIQISPVQNATLFEVGDCHL